MTALEADTIRIQLVDDHELVRSGVRMLLEVAEDIQVISETSTRTTTLEVARTEQPDVILLDLHLGTENGLELIPELRNVAPKARILVLTGDCNLDLHKQAVRLGAVGLVLKSHSTRVLVDAIRQVFAGQAWLDPSLVASVVTDFARGNEGGDPEAAKIKHLTEREREVIGLICEGLQNKMIAQRLSISDTTVRHHLTSIFAKLELESRLELVIYAYRHGLAHLTA